MEHGRKSVRHVVSSQHLQALHLHGPATQGCEFMLVMSRSPSRLTKQYAGDNVGSIPNEVNVREVKAEKA